VARPGIVHRIDKDTSGLLVVAKSDLAHEGLARQFADHSLARAYLAVASGHPRPAQGTVAGRIGRSDTNRKKMAVLPDASSRGKRGGDALPHARGARPCGARRVSARDGSHPPGAGAHGVDRARAARAIQVYGRTPAALRPVLAELGFGRQALHAAELGFVHPASGERVHFSSDLPPDMLALVEALRGARGHRLIGRRRRGKRRPLGETVTAGKSGPRLVGVAVVRAPAGAARGGAAAVPAGASAARPARPHRALSHPARI
jgi:23S rRNA pseudouridine1911/1915/1917 synthase